MKISQLKKLLKEYPDDEVKQRIDEKIKKIEKNKLDKVKLENSKEFGILADQIKELIAEVKRNKFPEQIEVKNPVKVEKVTVNIPDDVKVNNLNEIKFPSEVSVKNFPKQKEIKIPDKFEIKNTEQLLQPLLKVLQKEDYPQEVAINRNSMDLITQIEYIFKEYKLTVTLTRNREGSITNIRYLKSQR